MIDDIDNYITEAIVKISNRPELIDKIEPNVCFHFQIEKWMVKRIVNAIGLLNEEFNKLLNDEQ